jgi:hypothetical protein
MADQSRPAAVVNGTSIVIKKPQDQSVVSQWLHAIYGPRRITKL